MKSTFLALLAVFLALPVFAQSGDPLPQLGGGILKSGTVPVNGTNEIQTLTFGGTPTGGTFKFAFKGHTTSAISWNATNGTLVSNIDTALEALTNIGTSGVTTAVGTMTSGIGTITVTFTGGNAKLNVDALTVASNALTGTSPTLAVTTSTPGVTADGRSAKLGTLDVALSGTGGLPLVYINQGTPPNPAWVKVGP